MRWTHFLDLPLLDERFPLPLDAPFTAAMAHREGVPRGLLTGLVDAGLLRRPIKGVYLASQAGDSLRLRAQCLALVTPEDAVVCDRHAGWMHGAGMVLAPNDHLHLPPVSMFLPSGRGRLRNGLAASGERNFSARDFTEIHGLRVATPLRVACDLGRLLHRDQSLAALDQLLRLAVFSREELLTEISRFRGMRGVVQLRSMAPIADGRSESPGESVLRLRWLDTGLPWPTPQLAVVEDGIELARLDLAEERSRFAAEYDGREWHSRPKDVARDQGRRDWLREDYGWHIRGVVAENIYGRHRDIEAILHEGFREARRARGRVVIW